MKKFLTLLIAFIFLAPPLSFAAEEKKKVGYVSITYETRDSFVIKSKLFYPTKKEKVYPMVVFLHSLGYNSDYWGDITKKFVDENVAVMLIDLRGHGQSVYDTSFRIRSWLYYTPKQFALYPEDITEILKYMGMNYRNISTVDYAIIGADVGANTAILAAEKMPNKPKCMALISPSRNFKELYTPIALTELGAMPIMAAVSVRDNYFEKEAYALEKFAQGDYKVKTYPKGGSGMMMLRSNPTMSDDIVKWVLSQIKANPVGTEASAGSMPTGQRIPLQELLKTK